MADFFPFRALRPVTAVAGKVASPPYDVVSREEAANLAADNPLSFLRVTRSEIELPAEVSPYDDAVYEHARRNLEKIRNSAPLLQDEDPSFYLYAMKKASMEQYGFAGTVSVAAYNAGRIRIHEYTRADKEEDRTRHIYTLRAHTGLVLLICQAETRIQAISEQIRERDPSCRVVDENGVEHILWQTLPAETTALSEAFAALPDFYIADGHHRAKSASRVHERCCREAPETGADSGCARFPVVVFPADQMRILAYNRVVKDLNGLSVAAFLDALRQTGELTPISDEQAAAPTAAGWIHVYCADRWYAFHPRNAGTNAIEKLDVYILQHLILDPILGIAEPRMDPRVRFIGGESSVERIREMVDAGEAAVGFSLYPTGIDQLMAVADDHGVMPPKSTWFEPKLRDGLLVHCF